MFSRVRNATTVWPSRVASLLCVSLVFRTCCVLGSHFWLPSVRVVSSASRDKADNGCRLSSYKAACVRRSREVNVANTSLKEPSRKEFCHIWAASSHRFQVSAGMRAIYGTSARDARQLPLYIAARDGGKSRSASTPIFKILSLFERRQTLSTLTLMWRW